MSTGKKRIEIHYGQAPDYILEFRKRIEALREKSGLTPPKFAESIGIAYNTYRTLLGKNPHRSGRQGATFQTIHEIATHLRTSELVWLLTGKNPDGKQTEPDPVSLETAKLLAKTKTVLESKNKPLVEALTHNINAFHEVVMPAQQITAEQAFDIVANKLVFFCSNPDCGKEVGSFTARDKLSDVCPFCGEVTNAKTYAEQIAALRIHFNETDDIEEIRRKIVAENSAPDRRKAKNDSH